MNSSSKFTVVDLNSGLGGRLLAFYESGFTVLAGAESEGAKREICRSILPNVPIVASGEGSDDASGIPSADVLLAEVRQAPSFSRAKGDRGAATNQLSFLSKVLLRDAPKAFLLQAPAMILRNKSFQLFDSGVFQRYNITYRVFREADHSGFPVSGNQTYFVGIRNDIAPDLFRFPAAIGGVASRTPLQESPGDVDPWYRKLPVSFKPPASQKNSYYYIDHKGKVVGGDQIFINRPRDCYLKDEYGFRRLTHNELAYLKGYQGFPFNKWTNRFKMYQMLQTASDIYVVRAIADCIRKLLEDSTAGLHPADQSALMEAQRKTQHEDASATRKMKVGSERPQRQEETLIRPRSRIRSLHIKKLKGLVNLDISMEKNLTAIMGVNGVGKSTILHALACMFSPFERGENHKFNFFFTPTPDASWQGSRLTMTYFDENTQSEVVRDYQKSTTRWSPRYTNRPKRDTFYLGVDSGLPEIEKERQTSYIDYLTNDSDDDLSERIITAASEILNKDYQRLTSHKTKTKKLFGVHTASDITYSSLSMGAGEQRLIKILTTVYHAAPYSLILIDEIDLLLHGDAQKRLIKKLSGIAAHKNLQIVFTTHSLEIGKLTDWIDIRYLLQTKERTLVYDRITPDIIYDMNRELEQPLAIYVEDDLAEAIVSHTARKLSLSRHIKLQNIGSAQNAFTLAAGLIIENVPVSNRLIVIDGDVYRTLGDKTKQLKKLLSGTEAEHSDKIATALSVIRQFSLPEGTPPEKFIFDMLLDLNAPDELTDCARSIHTVSDPHDWLDLIVERMNQERGLILYQIIEQVSEHNKWGEYIREVRNWLLAKNAELNGCPYNGAPTAR